MGDTYVERQMIGAIKDLDLRIADQDFSAASTCCDRIRELDSQTMQSFGPSWLSDIVRNRGLRVPYLERALQVDKVVIGGDVVLKDGFLDALRGNKTLPFQEVKIEIRIDF